MTAVTEPGAVDWVVREAEAELCLGADVSVARLRRLVEADVSRPCLAGDPEAWFPVHETPEGAASLCSGCAVLRLCEELAVRHSESGIWGGTTTQDRVRLLRRRRRAAMTTAAVAAAAHGTAA